MKSRFFVLCIAVAGFFMLQSCEDSLLDVNQTFTYANEFHVQTTVDSSFSISEVVDLASQDSIIAEYGNKIKEIKVTQVKYWLTTFEGSDNQKIKEATLKVADQNGGGMLTMATITDQNLKALLNTPTALTVNQDAISSLQELIKNSPHKFMLNFNNSCNADSLNFTMNFEFTIEMVANPL